MIKNLFYSAVAVVVFFSCKAIATDGYVIDGNIQGLNTPYVYLSYAIGDSLVSDSVAVKNGTFQFNGKINEPAFGTLQTGDGHAFGLVVEGGKISVEGAMDSLDKVKIKGGTVQSEYNDYKASVDYLASAQKRIFSSMMDADGDNAARAEAIQKLSVLNQELNTINLKYVGDHPKSFVSLILLNNLGDKIAAEEFEKHFKALDKTIQNSHLGRRISNRFETAKKTDVGAMATNFTQPDVNGKVVQLAEFKGKFVLVDFWASWCKPCRDENPNVVAAYNKYKDKNFTVLGVSLDDNAENWKKAIQEDGLIWTQLSDLKGAECAAAQLYNIESIPSNFLISPEGIIIAKNLRGDELEKRLAEMLK